MQFSVMRVFAGLCGLKLSFENQIIGGIHTRTRLEIHMQANLTHFALCVDLTIESAQERSQDDVDAH
jgi:hypothetical protein